MVDAMLRFFYTFDYDTDNGIQQGAPLPFDIKVCLLAEKYCLEMLEAYAMGKFSVRIVEDWSQRSFIEGISMLYDIDTRATRAMRGLIMDIVAAGTKTLFHSVEHGEFQDVATCNPVLMLDLIQLLTKEKAAPLRAPSTSLYMRCPEHRSTGLDSRFSVSKRLSDHHIINCPLGCGVRMSKKSWEDLAKE